MIEQYGTVCCLGFFGPSRTFSVVSCCTYKNRLASLRFADCEPLYSLFPCANKQNATTMADEQRSSITAESSSSANKEKTTRSSARHIGWGDLEIYEFPNILGDNPATSDGGAPITIGWKHENKSVVAIDYYEFLRQSHPRRKRKDLAVSGGQRDT